MNLPNDHRTGHHDEADQAFVQHARELWQEAARRIDPTTAGQLRAARRRALDSARTPTSHATRWLIPTGALAMVALAALMVHEPAPQQLPVTPMNTAVVAVDADNDDNDLPPDAEQADPDLYQDLDFYGWLAANQNYMAAH